MAINMTGTREIQSPNPLSLTSPCNGRVVGQCVDAHPRNGYALIVPTEGSTWGTFAGVVL
ncbi:hypothetical protein L210DRAFT_954291, partial [Boletus edulis BED1]